MIRELKTFIAVAQEGSFAAAGGKIGLTQSAVSAQMQRLENELGLALFERAGRSARISKAGRQVLSEAQAEVAAAKVKAVTKLIELHTPGQRVSEVLVEEADAWSAELIVCGTHGRKGMSRIFLGSVAEGIVRLSTKPVFLVRGQPEPGNIS